MSWSIGRCEGQFGTYFADHWISGAGSSHAVAGRRQSAFPGARKASRRHTRRQACARHSPAVQPGSREQLGVRRNAVILAFEQLESDGLVEERRGAGTFVASRLPVGPAKDVPVAPPPFVPSNAPFAVGRTHPDPALSEPTRTVDPAQSGGREPRLVWPRRRPRECSVAPGHRRAPRRHARHPV